MASSSHQILSSVHILTSDATRSKRASLINALETSLGKIAPPSHIKQVYDAKTRFLEPEAIPGMLSAWKADKPLADLDPKNVPDPAMSQLARPLHVRSISNTLKHHEAILEIAKNYESSGAKYALVVEDDAVFSEEQMLDAVTRAIKNAPADAELIFMGLPSKRSADSIVESGKAEYDDVSELIATQVLPACDSYLIACSAADRIASGFLPVRFSTNIQWTYLIRSGVVRKAYIAVPNAFVDGSKLGVFPSSISTNNQLIWNPGYCQLMSMVAQKDVAGFEALWNKQTAMLQNHPDALVLLGDYYLISGREKDAEIAYERALKTYEAEGCLVNNTSEFMKRYMSVYRTLLL
jgi:GR25 family glycosyltransferase involved in LPS biosynthesis